MTPLRLAVLINGFDQPRWVYELLRDVQASRFASVVLAVVRRGSARPQEGLFRRIARNRRELLHIAYVRLDRWLFGAGPDPFEPRDIRDLIPEASILDVEPRETRYSDYLTKADVDEFRSHGIDVGIRFGFRILRGDVLSSTRYGIWSYHHGDNLRYRGGPACFWEIMENRPESGAILQVLSDELDGGEVLARTFSRTNPYSLSRNRSRVYWKAAPLVLRGLRDLHLRCEAVSEQASSGHTAPYSGRLYRVPNNREMIGYVTRVGMRQLLRRYSALARQEQWFLAYKFARESDDSEVPDLTPYSYRRLVPPPDRFWADPFPVVRDGRHFVYVEELLFSSNKGRIVVMEIGAEGMIGEPVVALEADHHLSYPFVFEWEGDLFMIPESFDAGTVALYRCVRFPDRWTLEATLLSGIQAADATITRVDGRWWLFACVAREGISPSDELHIFSADTPRGPWQPHARNPVVVDVRCARPAGRLFVWNGQLIRPSQDCSRRHGHAIVLNEVLRLDDAGYQEREIGRITPDWSSGLLGTHTINRAGGLSVIDAVRPSTIITRLGRTIRGWRG